MPTQIERLDRRLDELEGMGEFAPGALGCSFDQAIDVSTLEAMMADLEVLADTCPQKHLIRFLRAAAFVSEVPAALAQPGARMDDAALFRTADNVSSAVQAIAGLAAALQEDPLIRGVDSVPARLRKILETALEERSVAGVIRDGDKLEGAFLSGRRRHLTQELDDEIERHRSEMSGQGTASPEIRRLRANIERIDRRLALLHAPPVDERALDPN
jgi:hypothetical protein